MDLKECYSMFEGDYEGVVSRLRSEKMVRKFALKFLKDTSYDLLLHSVQEENYEEAFRAAHTIKGVCQNLGFSGLGESSSQLTEALRGGWTEEAGPFLEQVKKDYEKTTGALRILEEESEG